MGVADWPRARLSPINERADWPKLAPNAHHVNTEPSTDGRRCRYHSCYCCYHRCFCCYHSCYCCYHRCFCCYHSCYCCYHRCYCCCCHVCSESRRRETVNSISSTGWGRVAVTGRVGEGERERRHRTLHGTGGE
ncbi:unnamed protein product [Lampetra fluviatilis]